MSGIDVWYLIAPILAKCLPLNDSDEAREAYVTTYIALKDYKEKEKPNEQNKA